MHAACASFAWFIFNLNTESHYLQIIHCNIYIPTNAWFNQAPRSLLSHVYLLGEPASLLVVANTLLLLSLVCQQLPHPLLALPPFHTPQIKLQYLYRRHQQHQPSSSGTLTNHFCGWSIFVGLVYVFGIRDDFFKGAKSGLITNKTILFHLTETKPWGQS
jgi:hypothetical protein